MVKSLCFSLKADTRSLTAGKTTWVTISGTEVDDDDDDEEVVDCSKTTWVAISGTEVDDDDDDEEVVDFGVTSERT